MSACVPSAELSNDSVVYVRFVGAFSAVGWRRQTPVEVEQCIYGAVLCCLFVTTFDFLCFCSQFYAAPRKLSEADMEIKKNKNTNTNNCRSSMLRDSVRMHWSCALFHHSRLHRNFSVHSEHNQTVRSCHTCVLASVPAYTRVSGPYVISIRRLRITIVAAVRCCFLSRRILEAKHTRLLQKTLWIFLFIFFLSFCYFCFQ